MKFAFVDGKRTEAYKGAIGYCPVCATRLTPRCGEQNVDHWSHKPNIACTAVKEPETPWHRSWKDKFPIEWQEVVHLDSNGEKHVADVKTPSEWVLEFQHSYLNPEERSSRNTFYKKLVWVVDGTRRPTDTSQFQNMLNESTVISQNPLIRRVYFPEECRLLREWHNGSNALVFFDFFSLLLITSIALSRTFAYLRAMSSL